MEKEIIIKQVGSGWIVTVWNRKKSDDFSSEKGAEQIFTDRAEMLDFVTLQA